jgi:hypothetical protein
MIVYAVVDDALSPDFRLGVEVAACLLDSSPWTGTRR